MWLALVRVRYRSEHYTTYVGVGKRRGDGLLGLAELLVPAVPSCVRACARLCERLVE
jgi:hypothetical protein